ncbi:MAG: hypothetical protein IKW39_04980, partial [Alphaproteobacteria bacterium]|nr:hypothetical protein [Alphaproteobacteria bacterium]
MVEKNEYDKSVEEYEKKKKEYEDMLGNVSSTEVSSDNNEDKQTDTEETTNKDKPEKEDTTNKKEEQETTKPKPEKQSTTSSKHSQGYSRAYEEVPECDIYGNPVIKDKKNGDNKQDFPKPPKRADKGKSGGESNIMDLFWKEFILASYDWIVNTSVDTVLDFVDYVLYSRNKSPEKTKEEKIDVFAIGSGIRKKTKDEMLKRKEVASKAFDEIVRNLEKDKNGLQVKWEVLKGEPVVFKKLSEINKKPVKSRTFEEKEIMDEFLKTPNVLNNLIDEGIGIREIAIASATCESAANYADKYAVSETFDKKLTELENQLKTTNKTSIKETITALKEELTPSKIKLFEDIKSSLFMIEEDVRKENYKGATEKIKSIRENCSKAVSSPEYWEKVISIKEKSYLEEISQEKEKIETEDIQVFSSDFDDSIILLNQFVTNIPEENKENKEELQNLLTDMVQGSSPTTSNEKSLYKHLNIILKKAEATSESEYVSSLKASMKSFTKNYNDMNNGAEQPLLTEEFSQKLSILNEKLEKSDKKQKEDKDCIEALLNSMSNSIEDDNLELLSLKNEINNIKETVQKASPNKIIDVAGSKIASLGKSYEELNPIKKKKRKYYKDITDKIGDLKGSIDEYTSGVMSVIG